MTDQQTITRLKAECAERYDAQVHLADMLAAVKKALEELVADCSDDEVDWPALTRAREVLSKFKATKGASVQR